MNYRALLFSVSAGIAAVQAGGAAEQVAAVLSSDSGYYREAFEGFKEAFGRPVPVYRAGGGLPRRTKVVVAFGKNAATLNYPDDVTLIYCLAPALEVDREKPGNGIEVSMIPSPRLLPKELKQIQPGLRRLAVLFSGAALSRSANEIRKAFAEHDVEAFPLRVPRPENLPASLRSLQGKADAILLLPDPQLINHATLSIFKSFSLDNKIPYYATSDLTEMGATVSVYVSFRELGRRAGAAAQEALKGAPSSAYIFSDHYEVNLNPKAAAEIGLNVPPDILKRPNAP